MNRKEILQILSTQTKLNLDDFYVITVYLENITLQGNLNQAVRKSCVDAGIEMTVGVNGYLIGSTMIEGINFEIVLTYN